MEKKAEHGGCLLYTSGCSGWCSCGARRKVRGKRHALYMRTADSFHGSLFGAVSYTHLRHVLAQPCVQDKRAVMVGDRDNDMHGADVYKRQDVPCAHKTGGLDRLSHDSGVFELPGRPYFIAVLIWDAPDIDVDEPVSYTHRALSMWRACILCREWAACW